MRFWGLLALCACNRILGLGDVVDRHVDAQQFDAPDRAAPQCPPVGAGVPVFGEGLHQLTDLPVCYQIVPASNGTMVGYCKLPPQDDIAQIASARAGEQLQPIKFVADPNLAIQVPRLGGDGTVAALQIYNSIGAGATIVELATIDDTGAWIAQGMLPIVPHSSFRLLTPSSGPLYHVVYFDDDSMTGAFTLFELAFDGGSWHEQAHYPLKPLGLQTATGTAAMTSDGLHIVATTYVVPDLVTVFSDRAAITDPFGAFRPLDTIPAGASDPFITDDCDKVYFSALDRVLYLKQD